MNKRLAIKNLLNNVPKAELHCHLFGVICRDVLLRLCQAGLHPLVAPDEVQPIRRPDHNAFTGWIRKLVAYQRASWRDYHPILNIHVEALIRQSVTYAELTISLLMFPSERDAILTEVRQFRHAVNEMQRGRIQVEFLILIPRTLPEERIEPEIEILLELHRNGLIVGVSVAGIIGEVPLRRLRSMLRRLRDAGLGVSVHAGEHTGPDEVWEAIDHCGAQRIGHGIGAFRDPELVARIAQDVLHLEFCLTSNFKTCAIGSLSEHPIHLARELGLNFSINTDDPGAFDCSMNSEYSLLMRYFDWTQNDLMLVYFNSLAASFGSPISQPVSLDNLNVSERCGCRPKAAQIRRIVVCEKPVAVAIERMDQCVASSGVDRRVRSITAAT